MNTLREHIYSWLFIETVHFGIKELYLENRYNVYDYNKESEWKHIPFDDQVKTIFEYIIENDMLKKPTYVGHSSKHSAFSMGANICANTKGVKGTYKDIEIKLKWNEVIDTIKEVLERSDNAFSEQITLLELLANKC